MDQLSRVDINKGPGPDGIPSIFLRQCAFSLSRPLWLLFNESLSTGIFPNVWKCSYVVPIYKNCGDKCDVTQYRPISLQPHFSKVFESIVNEYLNLFFKNIITTRQHGFLSGRSVDTNLMVYVDYLSRALERGVGVDAVYTDFSKAFDKVDHCLLLNKLYNYGDMLNWLSSYLKGRTQIVKIKNCYLSQPLDVTSGVPQGAHLAPLLFNIFINDITSCFHYSEFLLYADDLKIYSALDHELSVSQLQEDLNRLCVWCEKNKMIINIDKCSSIQFTRSILLKENKYVLNNLEIDNVNIIKDLGILFDKKITFNDHVVAICNKAFKMLGFIRRHTRDFNNVQVIKVLYTSLVRSHVETGAPIWSPNYQLYANMIERVQKKFIRYCAFKLGMSLDRVDYNDLCARLGLETLDHRRIKMDALFVYKLVNGVIHVPELLSLVNFRAPCRVLRGTSTFEISNHRTLYGAHRSLDRLLQSSDLASADIFNSSAVNFKNSIRL